MWLDDIGTRLEQAGKKIGNDIGSYLSSIKIEPTVLIGQAPDGNRTAAEVENQTAKIDFASNALMLLSVAGVAYLIFFAKGKGKK